MVDTKFSGGIPGISEKAKEMADGTFARILATIVLNADGSIQAMLPPGRAAAASSAPVVLSNEDKAALDAANGGYSTAAAYVIGTTRTPGRGILASVTTAGSAIFTFGGVAITVPLAVGPTILPLAVTKVEYPGSGAAAGAFYAIS